MNPVLLPMVPDARDPAAYGPPIYDRTGTLRVTQAGQEPRDFDAAIYRHDWFDRDGQRHLMVQECNDALMYHWVEFTAPVTVEYLPE